MIPGNIKAGFKACNIDPLNPKLYHAVPFTLVSKQTKQLKKKLTYLFGYLLQSPLQRNASENNDNVNPADDLSQEILHATPVVDEPAIVDEPAVVVEPVHDTLGVITDPEAGLSLFIEGEIDTDLWNRCPPDYCQLEPRSSSYFPLPLDINASSVQTHD